MASKVDLKGYDHQFVNPPPDELLCLICTLLAREPQQTTCCGKVYCKVCIEELVKHTNKCPQCREEINCFPDKRSKFRELATVSEYQQATLNTNYYS